MNDELEKKDKKPARSLTTYLIILFLAALLLLLLSFFMQQRQALMDLSDTVAASQNVTELQLENQQLEFRLQEEQRQRKSETQKLQEDLDQAAAQAEEARKQAQALEWLRQIEAATRSSYGKAKDLTEDKLAASQADYETAKTLDPACAGAWLGLADVSIR